jgi:hypothetical protein
MVTAGAGAGAGVGAAGVGAEEAGAAIRRVTGTLLLITNDGGFLISDIIQLKITRILIKVNTYF